MGLWDCLQSQGSNRQGQLSHYEPKSVYNFFFMPIIYPPGHPSNSNGLDKVKGACICKLREILNLIPLMKVFKVPDLLGPHINSVTRPSASDGQKLNGGINPQIINGVAGTKEKAYFLQLLDWNAEKATKTASTLWTSNSSQMPQQVRAERTCS